MSLALVRVARPAIGRVRIEHAIGIDEGQRHGVALLAERSAAVEAGPAARELGRKLADAVTNGFCDPAQEAILADNRAYFQAIVVENRDFRPEEYDRWVRMGWIE